MIDIVAILNQISELEFWTRCPLRDASGSALSYPPVIVWRHKFPTPELAELLRDTIASFPATISWEFTTTERNWLLAPSRVKEYAQENNLLGDLPAAKELKMKDPDFGRRANAELKLLAEHIAKTATPVAGARM